MKMVSNPDLIVSIYSSIYLAHILQLIFARSLCQKLGFFSSPLPPSVVSLMLHVAKVDSIKKHDL